MNCGPAQWDARLVKGYFPAGADLLLGMEQHHLVKLWVYCYAYVSELHLCVLIQLEDQHVLTMLCLVPGHCLHTTANQFPIYFHCHQSVIVQSRLQVLHQPLIECFLHIFIT